MVEITIILKAPSGALEAIIIPMLVSHVFSLFLFLSTTADLHCQGLDQVTRPVLSEPALPPTTTSRVSLEEALSVPILEEVRDVLLFFPTSRAGSAARCTGSTAEMMFTIFLQFTTDANFPFPTHTTSPRVHHGFKLEHLSRHDEPQACAANKSYYAPTICSFRARAICGRHGPRQNGHGDR